MNKNRIRELRDAKGWTLQQAADAAGMTSRQHWYNIESGKQESKSISIELLERIAAALGVQAVDLITPVKRKGAK